MRNRILVVEDDLELVELLKFNLAKAGFCVFTAVTGSDALKKARGLHPDLILLDLMLPELDGFAICEILRRDASTAKTLIIMLTAMSSQLARVAGLGAGANDFICKPFSTKLLLTRIQKLLGVPPKRSSPIATADLKQGFRQPSEQLAETEILQPGEIRQAGEGAPGKM